jgi:hypothetical protein
MKKIILPLLIAGLTFVSCKKSAIEEDTQSLNVVEKNMSVIAKRTATWCGPCGDWGFPGFETLENNFEGDAVFMAWKDAFVSPKGTELFDEVGPLFDLGNGVPTFFTNFVKSGNNTEVVANHKNAPVIANSNYNFSISGNKVNLNTTTKFFQDVEGDYLMAPYMIVDGIIGFQAGHADGANTEHHKYVADIAKPVTASSVENFGYTIAKNGAKVGHTVSMEFELTKDASWDKNDISFGLIIFRQESSDSLTFINAFTK